MSALYPTIELTHANNNHPQRFVVGTGFTYSFYDPAKSVVIWTPVGIFPVKESLDEITSKINQINAQTGQGEK